MKAKILKSNAGEEETLQTINTDDQISDFEFMYQMFRLHLSLDIDSANYQKMNGKNIQTKLAY